MTKQRVPRRLLQHRGVRLVRLADGRAIARWLDPQTGATKQQSMDRLGLTTEKQRHEWCCGKAVELADVRRAMSTGALVASGLSIEKVVADYLATIKKASTKVAKERVLDALTDWCAQHRIATVADLTGPRLMRWRDHVLRPESKHRTSTQNKWLVTCGIFLRWATDRGLSMLTREIIGRACVREKVQKRAIVFLQPDDLRRLLQVVRMRDATARVDGKPLAPFVLALLLSGCRFQELARLEWHEVDFAAGEIRLAAERTKTGRERSISWRESPTLGLLLRALHDAAAGVGPVFGWLHSTWDAARIDLIESGTPKFTAHTLRRTCGTILTNAGGIYGGASAWHSAKRLGHSVQMSEQLYAGLLRDLPPTATTIEAAAGIEAECRAIVAAASRR